MPFIGGGQPPPNVFKIILTGNNLEELIPQISQEISKSRNLAYGYYRQLLEIHNREYAELKELIKKAPSSSTVSQGGYKRKRKTKRKRRRKRKTKRKRRGKK